MSRQLNMSVHELRSRIRAAGFRVSVKARKVDNSLAKEIIKKLSGAPAQAPVVVERVGKVEIPPFVTVKEFSERLKQPVTEVIKKLIQNGVMATINEEIDAETATIIAADFGAEIEVQREAMAQGRLGAGYVQDLLSREDSAKLKPRPPIVAVMGHVDHGKTTLLDTIRKTNVVATEAGAITQKIGAYQVTIGHPEGAEATEGSQGDFAGRKITFLDTPGHEAFAAMRARGANVTDIIVLVVAADDSVKPQTVEVINRAKLTKTPLIVAINKIDKPGASPDKTKADLASLGVTVEDWGGTTPSAAISAKQGTGIDKLLELILLAAEVEELRANPTGQVLGTVIDSHLSRGQGAVATVLVQNGELRVGDPIVVGTAYGKTRSMEDAMGRKVKAAPPSTPVLISGLSDVPEVGDILKVVANIEEAKQQALALQKQERAKRLQSKPLIKLDPKQRELKVILRAGVQGSMEALHDALLRLGSDEVKLNIVDQGVGEITDSDITLAENTRSVILGFHTKAGASALKLAKLRGVTVDLYEVIYELIEDVTSVLLAMMPVEIQQVILGRAKIKAVFRTEKDSMIIGGEVIEGRVVDKKKFKIFRTKTFIGEGKIDELQQNRVEAPEVLAGKEFGLKVLTQKPILAGDILEVFDEQVKKREAPKT